MQISWHLAKDLQSQVISRARQGHFYRIAINRGRMLLSAVQKVFGLGEDSWVTPIQVSHKFLSLNSKYRYSNAI
jgi:hypothetical protein